MMFIVKLVCEKRNSFSIGEDYTRSLSTIIHSDTLFSTLCNNIRMLFGKSVLESFLEKLISKENENFFKLSSAFHYLDILKQENYFKTIYFIPKPFIRFPFDARSKQFLLDNPKKIKRINFISIDVVRQLQEGIPISISEIHILDNKYLLSSEDLKDLGLEQYLSLLEKPDSHLEKIHNIIKKRASVYQILEEQKVKISRLKKETLPFQYSKLKFTPTTYFIDNGERINYQINPGIYFLLSMTSLSEDLQKYIRAAIKLIPDEGIGGKRSTGCGLFDEIQFIELSVETNFHSLINSKKDMNYFTNISLVFPSRKDMDSVEFFNLFDRSGFAFSLDTTSLRINDLKFLREGSIFTKKITGRLVQVASEEFKSRFHNVYKNGIGFYIGIGKSGEDK